MMEEEGQEGEEEEGCGEEEQHKEEGMEEEMEEACGAEMALLVEED